MPLLQLLFDYDSERESAGLSDTDTEFPPPLAPSPPQMPQNHQREDPRSIQSKEEESEDIIKITENFNFFAKRFTDSLNCRHMFPFPRVIPPTPNPPFAYRYQCHHFASSQDHCAFFYHASRSSSIEGCSGFEQTADLWRVFEGSQYWPSPDKKGIRNNKFNAHHFPTSTEEERGI